MYVIIDNKKYRVYFKNGQYFITTRKVEKHKIDECKYDIKDSEPIVRKSKKTVRLKTLKENDKKMRKIVSHLTEKLEICTGLYSLASQEIPKSPAVRSFPLQSERFNPDASADKDDTIASLRSELLRSRVDIERVNKERDRALQELDRCMAEFARLNKDAIKAEETDQLTYIESLNEDASEKLRDCDGRIEVLNNRVKELQRELERITEHDSELIARTTRTSEENDAKIATLTYQIEIHRNANETLTAEVQQKRDEVEKYIRELAEIRRSSDISTEERTKITDEIKIMRKLVWQLEENHQEKLRLSNIKITDLQGQLDESRMSIDNLKEQVKEKSLEINRCTYQLRDLQSTSSASIEEKIQLKAEIQRMQLYLEQLKKEHQDFLTLLNNRIRDLEQEISSRDRQNTLSLQELKKEKDSTLQALNQAKENLQSMELRNGELIAQLRNSDTVDNDFEQKLQECNELSTRALENLRADVNKCTVDLATCNKDKDLLFSKLNDKSAEVKLLFQKNEDLNLELNLLTSANTDLASRLDEAIVKSQCEDKVKTIEELTEELAQSEEIREREKTEYQAEIQHLLKKNEQYEIELNEGKIVSDREVKRLEDVITRKDKIIIDNNDAFRRRLASLEEKGEFYDKLRHEKMSLIKEVEERDEIIEKLRSDLEAQSFQYRRKISSDAGEIQSLTEEVGRLNEESESQYDEITKSSKYIDELKRKNTQLLQRLSEYETTQ